MKKLVCLLCVLVAVLAVLAVKEYTANGVLKTELAKMKSDPVILEGFPGGFLYKSVRDGENLRAEFRWIEDCKLVAAMMMEGEREKYFCTEGKIKY